MIAEVRIGARVFVGANSTILPGVTIGDDAIVGAGSVVRRDVKPGTIVVASPAAEVGTTEQHTRRHRAEVQRRPCHLVALDPRAQPMDRRQVLEDLANGVGYVE
jgi:acetyltransferase-like isoleucine patch superfamily enzyme